MTRNNNSYRFKGRAVFLAAIMVISMLAMPVAFTGVAAADFGGSDEGELTFNGATNLTAGASADAQNVSYLVNMSGVDEGDTDEINIDYSEVEDLSDDAEVVGVDWAINNSYISVEDTDFDDDEVTVTVANASSSQPTTDTRLDLTVALELGDDVSPEQGIELTTTNASGDVQFSNDTHVRGANATDRSRVYEGQQFDAINSSIDDGDTIEFRGDDYGFIDEAEADGSFVTFDIPDDAETGDDFELINNDDDDAVVASFDYTSNNFVGAWNDETVQESGETVTDVEIDLNRNRYSVYVTSDDYDADEIYERFNHSNADNDLTATANNNSLPEQDAIVETDNGVIFHEITDDDYEADFNGEDTGFYEFEFDVSDTVATDTSEIEVVDGEDNDLQFVDDAPVVVQGDIAEIEIEEVGSTDDGTLVIGDFEDDGYEAVIEIDDIDEDIFTIEFNTYLAGLDDSEDFIESDGEGIVDSDDVEVELLNINGGNQQIDSILADGSYDMVLSGDTITAAEAKEPDDVEDELRDDADIVGGLFVEERFTGDVELWTASNDVASDLDEIDDITDAIDEETLTPTDSIAFQDAIVQQTEVTGIGGLFAAADDGDMDPDLDDALVELMDDRSMELFDVEQTEDSVTANRDPKALNASNASDFDMNAVYEDDELFIVFEQFDNDDDDLWVDRNPSDGEDYFVNFNVTDERLLEEGDEDPLTPYATDDEDEDWLTLEAETGVEDREGEFINLNDDDEVEVTAAEDQPITAETNIAPGSELNIRASGTDGARFVKTERDLVVGTNEEVEGSFDFSDRTVDEQFEVEFQSVPSGFEEDDEVDGIIVDAEPEEEDDEEEVDDEEEEVDDEEEEVDDEEEEVDDEEEEVDDEEEEVDDEEEEVDDEEEEVDDEEEEETDDETPGFGALVAFVSLLGAALLAARRQN